MTLMFSTGVYLQQVQVYDHIIGAIRGLMTRTVLVLKDRFDWISKESCEIGLGDMQRMLPL